MSSSSQLDGLLGSFETLIAFYSTHPHQCDMDRLLRANVSSQCHTDLMYKDCTEHSQFDVHEMLKNHQGVRRSSYLIQAMDILKTPLRNNLPIPWEKIKELDILRNVGVQERDNNSLAASNKQRLNRVEVASATFGDEALHEMKSKWRKLGHPEPMGQKQHPSSRSNQKKKMVEIDDGEDIRVKMEDMHVEVS